MRSTLAYCLLIAIRIISRHLEENMEVFFFFEIRTQGTKRQKWYQWWWVVRIILILAPFDSAALSTWSGRTGSMAAASPVSSSSILQKSANRPQWLQFTAYHVVQFKPRTPSQYSWYNNRSPSNKRSRLHLHYSVTNINMIDESETALWNNQCTSGCNEVIRIHPRMFNNDSQMIILPQLTWFQTHWD